ncbi:hypothetical protein [Methylorubrum extorquens]|nr:hypothetical protein [Methylorubrum extorquens]
MAEDGAPDVAVNLAVALLHDESVATRRGDLTMSLLALHALDGHAPAATVLAHGLAMLSHSHRRAARLFQFSDVWSDLASRPTCGP